MPKIAIRIFFFLLSVFYAGNLKATHIVGGNLAYKYLGPSGAGYQYQITFKTYIDCNSPFWLSGFPEPILPVGVYEGPASPSSSLPRVAIVNMPIVDSMPITANVSSTCAVGTNICVYEITYQANVILPLSFQGYHLFYDRCCRVGSIVNLNLPGNQGLAFHAYIPPTLVNNSSPVFTDVPVPYLCVNDTASILNTAFDPDGDVLIFSFEDPYQGFGTQIAPAPPLPLNLPWPIPPVNWQFGYNKNQPFGATGYNYINSVTGYSRYMSNANGDYVVAVEIKEYRNGNLIGITRRDMQILVGNCPGNPAPNLVAASGSGVTSYTITEGDTLCFPIIYSDALGDSVTLTANGAIFTASLVSPAATINTPVVGDSVVSTNFCWNTACGQARPLPYYFTVSVTDNGCPNKTTNNVYSILINPFQGPTTINGPNTSCSFSTGVGYNVTSIPGASYSWTITGGTQASGGNSNSITVNWGAAGVGVVRVRTTSPNGCDAGTLTKNVSLSSGPTADAGNDTTICSGSTITIGGIGVLGYLYTWSPTTGLNNPNFAAPQLTLTNGTGSVVSHTYVVSVSDTALGCSTNDTVVITVNPMPPVNAGNDITICIGNSTTLTASGANTYIWNPATGLSTSTGANPTASPTVSTTYTVTGTDAIGCTNTDIIAVTVVTSAPADAGTGNWVCPGDSVMLNGSGGVSYSWSPATGLSNSTISNPMASPTTTTNYTLTVTDASGCTGTDTLVLIVAGNVPVDPGNNQQICLGDSVTIGGTPTGPVGSTYSWVPATGLNNPTSANPVASPTVTTKYYVTVVNDTCSGIDSVEVTVLPLPVITLSSDTSICIGDSIILTAGGGTSYQWLPSTGLNNSTGTSVTARPSVNTTYTVTVTDGNSCINTDSVIITLNPLPNIDAGPNATICNGISTTLTASGGVSYIWTPSTGLSTSTGANPTAQPTTQTSYTVTGTDINSCSNIDSVLISLSASPTITVSNNDTICRGEFVTLSASGGINYTWLPSGGLSSTTGTPVNASPTSSTTYTVAGADSLGCVGTDTVRITVNQLPGVDAGNNASICIGSNTTLNATGAANYIWTPSAGLSNTSIANPTTTTTITTTYYVTGTDTNGCVNSDSVIISVNPLPTIDAGINTSICQGDSASLTATGGTSYSWAPPGSLSSPNNAITFAFPTTPTTYTVTGVDGNGCINRDTVNVSVFFIDVADTFICAGSNVTLNASHGGAVSYTWLPSEGLSSTNTAATIASPTVQTTYTVTAVDTAGCVSVDVVTVRVEPNPTADFSVAFKPACDSIIGTFTNNSTGAISYEWIWGDGTTDSTLNPIHKFPYSKSYSIILRAINEYGCENTDTLSFVLADFNFYLNYTQPNVFTPNYDGFNDVFNIGLNGEYLGCTSLKIYNRWGVLLFETEQYNRSWDGRTTSGEPVPEGTYYYVYKIKDIELKGFVTLLR